MTKRNPNVELTCKQCNKTFLVRYKERNKRKFCSVVCSRLSFYGPGNPAYGKTYRTKATHPEWVANISKAAKEQNHLMLGDNNPMRNPSIAAKMAQTRREKVTSNPKYREERSACMRKKWADGAFDDVAVGRCKWYSITLNSGEIIKVQGTWEVIFARWMDKSGIKFVTHKGKIPYLDDEGRQRSYMPDFYVPVIDTYYDIKGMFYDELGKKKYEWITSQHPTMKLVMVDREYFKNICNLNIIAEANKIMKEFS